MKKGDQPYIESSTVLSDYLIIYINVIFFSTWYVIYYLLFIKNLVPIFSPTLKITNASRHLLLTNQPTKLQCLFTPTTFNLHGSSIPGSTIPSPIKQLTISPSEIINYQNQSSITTLILSTSSIDYMCILLFSLGQAI